MAQVVITITINPDSPEVDLAKLEQAASREVTAFGGKMYKTEQEPIGFGLKAVKLIFTMDESKGSPDDLEQKISSLPGVASARVTDARRTIG
jgi:elongation factor 1-beta